MDIVLTQKEGHGLLQRNSVALSITEVCKQRKVAWISGRTAPSRHLRHRACWWTSLPWKPLPSGHIGSQGLLGAGSRITDWSWGSRSETHTPDNFWRKKRNEGKILIIIVLGNL